MPARADPYQVLGVERGAGPEEIRRAFRRAALRCHPDSCPGDPAEAKRRFCELVEAYQAVLRSVGSAAWARVSGLDARTFTPRDFAYADFEWYWPNADASEPPSGAQQWPGWAGKRKFSYPTVNEPAIFAGLWVLAIAVAVTAAYFLGGFASVDSFRELDGLDILARAGLSLGIYAAVLAGTVFVLILTRKIVWLTVQLGFWRRALPGSPKKLKNRN